MHGTSQCSVRKRGAYWKEFKNAFCLWISQLLSLRKAIAGWGLCWSGRSSCEWFKGDSWITAFLFYFYSIFSLPFLLGELFVQLLNVAVWLISVFWVWSSNRRGKYERTVLLKTGKNGKSRKLRPGDKAAFICFLFQNLKEKWKGKQNFSIRVRECFLWLEKNGTNLWRKERTDREVSNGCCKFNLGFSTQCSQCTVKTVQL